MNFITYKFLAIPLIIFLIEISTVSSFEIDQKAASDMEFLKNSSKNIQVNLLDLDKEETETESELDQISIGQAAPIREEDNHELNIDPKPITNVKNLLKRGNKR